MKVVINTRCGGYSISPLATKELAKRKGKECFFFTTGLKTPVSIKEAEKDFCYFAYSVKNPQDYQLNKRDAANERAEKISLNDIANDRSDKDLIDVVEMLGKKANGPYAELKIVEIPDDVEWVIDEDHGLEHIAEVHRTWS
jgi:hypothetical protein